MSAATHALCAHPAFPKASDHPENETGKRRVVVVMRERGGKALPFVFKTEGASVPTIMDRVSEFAIVHADDASWISFTTASLPSGSPQLLLQRWRGLRTSQAESCFSRLRRAEIGTHHQFAGRYLACYANEMAWRENKRRVSNGAQYLKVTEAALNAPVSRQWAGYRRR